MNLKPGSLLQGGRYKIEEVLGQGGFGITYLGVQKAFDTQVAIKEFFMQNLCNRDTITSQISVGSTGSSELVERFRQKFIKEARNIYSLKHKHIIPVIDIFEENGTAYYVMEHISGGSLADKVLHGALPEAEAVRYIRQVAEALDFVHSKNIIHLDVKPANILINDEDNAILIDFGLSKQYDEKGHQTSTTPVGISHGYAPLEQYAQGGVGTFSPSTDIYSLGATLFKLVTGITPPQAAVVNDDGLPALPQEISAPVRTAIETAMQPRRKERPQSIKDFLAILECKDIETEKSKVISYIDESVATELPPVNTVPPRLEKEETDEETVIINSHKPSASSPRTVSTPLETSPKEKENKRETATRKNSVVLIAAIVLFVIAGAVALLMNGSSEPAERSTSPDETNTSQPENSISPDEAYSKGTVAYENKNYYEAVKWFHLAAKQGHAPAQHSLGTCYFEGNGEAKSYDEATLWYEKASEQGYAPAQFDLGWCYYEGKGKTKSYNEATKWYKKAADQGYAPAQLNLGICYYNGHGVKCSHSKALELFIKAADQGVVQAYSWIGMCYENGDGVKQSWDEAAKWYYKAAEQGDNYSKESLERLGY